MATESFKASVQYGDWEGTAAADGAHASSLHEYLTRKKLIEEDEFVIAASLYTGEGDFASINAIVFKGQDGTAVKAAIDANDGPLQVRRVRIEITPKEFLALFKRFDVILTRRGLELEGREYDYD